MSKIFIGGNPAYWDSKIGHYRYKDDNSIIEGRLPECPEQPQPHKPCPKCGLNPKDYDGHDPCIANLPGVIRACCGHGVKKGSILFENGVKIKGDFTITKTTIKYKESRIGRGKSNQEIS